MTKRTLAFLLAFLAAPAWSLSCMRPDAVFLYQEVTGSADDYYIVKGTLAFKEAVNEPKPHQTKDSAADTRARVTGMALSQSGLNVPFDRDVTVHAKCRAVWCPDVQGLSQGTFLMALRLDGDDLTLLRTPCGGLAVPWDQSGEDRLLDCHLNGDCRRSGF